MRTTMFTRRWLRQTVVLLAVTLAGQSCAPEPAVRGGKKAPWVDPWIAPKVEPFLLDTLPPLAVSCPTADIVLIHDGGPDSRLVAGTPGCTVVISEDGGDNWQRLVPAEQSHRAVQGILPGSSSASAVCVQVAPAAADHERIFCSLGVEQPWHALPVHSDYSLAAVSPIVVARGEPKGPWIFGVTSAPTISMPVDAMEMSTPYQQLLALESLTGDWSLSPDGFEGPFNYARAAVAGMIIDREQQPPTNWLCGPRWRCRSLDAAGRTGQVVAVSASVLGRELRFAPGGSDYLYYADAAAGVPRVLLAQPDHCFLIDGGPPSAAAGCYTSDTLHLWGQDATAPPVVTALPEQECTVTPAGAGRLLCLASERLWASDDQGASWRPVCQAGQCALFDATAAGSQSSGP